MPPATASVPVPVSPTYAVLKFVTAPALTESVPCDPAALPSHRVPRVSTTPPVTEMDPVASGVPMPPTFRSLTRTSASLPTHTVPTELVPRPTCRVLLTISVPPTRSSVPVALTYWFSKFPAVNVFAQMKDPPERLSLPVPPMRWPNSALPPVT